MDGTNFFNKVFFVFENFFLLQSIFFSKMSNWLVNSAEQFDICRFKFKKTKADQNNYNNNNSN